MMWFLVYTWLTTYFLSFLSAHNHDLVYLLCMLCIFLCECQCKHNSPLFALPVCPYYIDVGHYYSPDLNSSTRCHGYSQLVCNIHYSTCMYRVLWGELCTLINSVSLAHLDLRIWLGSVAKGMVVWWLKNVQNYTYVVHQFLLKSWLNWSELVLCMYGPICASHMDDIMMRRWKNWIICVCSAHSRNLHIL